MEEYIDKCIRFMYLIRENSDFALKIGLWKNLVVFSTMIIHSKNNNQSNIITTMTNDFYI